MDYIENNILNKHPALLVDHPVPLGRIVERLMKQYDAEQFAAADVPSLQMHRFNAFHLPINDELKLSMDQLQIKAIKIPISQKSLQYTKKDFISKAPEAEDYIYLAYEEKVGYHYSNSNMLFLEVALAKGITQKEIDQNTLEYRDYVSYLKSYLELYADQQ